jgi:hypothetical protein
LSWLKDLIRVSYLDEALQQKPISDLRAHVTVLARAVRFEEVFALPSIILYLNRCHVPTALCV